MKKTTYKWHIARNLICPRCKGVVLVFSGEEGGVGYFVEPNPNESIKCGHCGAYGAYNDGPIWNKRSIQGKGSSMLGTAMSLCLVTGCVITLLLLL